MMCPLGKSDAVYEAEHISRLSDQYCHAGGCTTAAAAERKPAGLFSYAFLHYQCPSLCMCDMSVLALQNALNINK